MKYLLGLLMLISVSASAQLTYYIRSDSVKIEKVGGSNELFIKNSTRGINGILTNVGGGRTQFIASRKVGDTLFIGKDTLTGVGSGSTTPPNIGSEFRVYSPQVPGFKTIAAGTNITLDTATANTLTISSTGGGPSVAADSIIGLFAGNPYTGSSLASDWTVVGTAPTFPGNGMQLTGGTNGNPLAAYVHSDNKTASANLQDTLEFTLSTAPSDSLGGIGPIKGSTNGGSTQAHIWFMAQRITSTTWRLVLKLAQAGGTFVIVDSTAFTVTMTAGDKYRIVSAWSKATAFGMLQHLDGSDGVTESVSLNYKFLARPTSSYLMPNTGWPGISRTGSGGSYLVTKFNEYHYELRHLDVVGAGTSIFERYMANSASSHFFNIMFENSNKTWAVYGGAGDRYQEMITRFPEISRFPPRYLVFDGEVNTSAADIRTNLTALIDSCQLYNIIPIVLQLSTDPAKDSIIINVCREQGAIHVNPGKVMNGSATYFVDGVHPNGAGNAFIANFLKAQCPFLTNRTGGTDQIAINDAVDANFSLLANNHIPVWNETTLKWENQSKATFQSNVIQVNATATPQVSASAYVDGYLSAQTGMAIGTNPIAGPKFYVTGNTTNGVQFRLENTNATSGTSTPYLDMYLTGSSMFGVANWQNALLMDVNVDGGTTFAHRTGGPFSIQIGTIGSATAQFTGSGLGLGKVSPSERLDVVGNIRFSGALMPNNAAGSSGQVLVSAGAGSPPTWGNIVSSGFSAAPTVTGITNVDAVSSGEMQWIRNGDIVSISGVITVDATATGTTVVDLTPIFASAFTVSDQANGLVNEQSTGGTAQIPGYFVAEPTGDKIRITFTARTASSTSYSYSGKFRIL